MRNEWVAPMSLLWGSRLFSGGLSPESAEVNAVEILWDSHRHEKISRTWYKTKSYHLVPSSSLNLTIRCKVGGEVGDTQAQLSSWL